MIKSSKAFLVTCSLAYHKSFIVPADSLSEAGIKAEKIVHDLDDNASVSSVREAVEVIDWSDNE